MFITVRTFRIFHKLQKMQAQFKNIHFAAAVKYTICVFSSRYSFS